MSHGSIIGFDLNDDVCQISFYDEKQQEPETLEVAADNYQIPLTIGVKRDLWLYGKEAKKLAITKGGYTVSNLFSKSLNSEKLQLGNKSYEAIFLLTKFIQLTLQSFAKIDTVVFCVPFANEDVAHMLKGIMQHLGMEKEHILVQDYKESFCNYMFYQPKELWQYETALFNCDRNEVQAYMLRKLKTTSAKGQHTFVTVDAVAEAKMKELAFVYPVLNIESGKVADERFKLFIQSVFDKKVVSSVFLTGEGFENNWYPNSLRVLCNGRRAFMGNNLYSKGACYTAYRKSLGRLEGPTYLDEDKLIDQISLKMRVNGQDEWYPIVSFGTHWYEADRQWEVLLEDTEDIEVQVESLTGGELQTHSISLEGLPERASYTVRIQIETLFLNKNTCKIVIRDVGFGEFYPATEFLNEMIIHLGGTNGQFNSLS
ncbi:DUF5716 family protein [Lachnospiraceae bacterium LCP25S3_G4]